MASDPTDVLKAHARISELIDSEPDFSTFGATQHRWLGQVGALLREHLDMIDSAHLSVAEKGLGSPHGFMSGMHTIHNLLFRVHAELDAKLPAQVHGSYIPVGAPMDAFVAVSRVLSGAKVSILVVDPYLDHTALEGFLATVPPGVALMLLADSAYPRQNAGLMAGAEGWRGQYASERPLDVRLTSAKALHDRLVIVDGSEVWLVSQSFKDLARRSPASIARAAPDVAELKVHFYLTAWESAAPR